MNRAIDIAMLVLVLVVGVWVALFGITGAVLAGAAGVRTSVGMVIGAVSGPFGIAWLAFQGRSNGHSSGHRNAEVEQGDEIGETPSETPFRV